MIAQRRHLLALRMMPKAQMTQILKKTKMRIMTKMMKQRVDLLVR